MSTIFDALGSIDDVIMDNLSGQLGKKDVSPVEAIGKPQDTSSKNKKQEPIVEVNDSVMREQLNLAKNKYSNKEDIQEDDTEDESSEDVDDNLDAEDSSSDDSPFIPYAAALKEAGILPNLNLKDLEKLDSGDRAQYLINENRKQIQETAINFLDEYVDSLPPRLKKAFETWSEGVDIEEAFDHANKLDQYKAITSDSIENNPELAKKILIEDKVASGMTKEDAEEEVNEMVNITRPAIKANERRIIKEEKKVADLKKGNENAMVEQERVNKDNLKQLKNFVNSTPEFIKGMPVNNKLRQDVWDSMTTSVSKDENGNQVNKIVADRNKNPLEFEIKLHYIYALTKGFTDFGNLKNGLQTGAIKQLEQKLASTEYNKGRSSNFGFSTKKSSDLLQSIKYTMDKD